MLFKVKERQWPTEAMKSRGGAPFGHSGTVDEGWMTKIHFTTSNAHKERFAGKPCV